MTNDKAQNPNQWVNNKLENPNEKKEFFGI